MLSVNACEAGPSCLVPVGMTDGGVAAALDRAERAMERIERALERQREKPSQDEQLRAKVREAIAELDELMRAVG